MTTSLKNIPSGSPNHSDHAMNGQEMSITLLMGKNTKELMNLLFLLSNAQIKKWGPSTPLLRPP